MTPHFYIQPWKKCPCCSKEFKAVKPRKPSKFTEDICPECRVYARKGFKGTTTRLEQLGYGSYL